MTTPSITVLSLCAVCSAAFAQTAPAPPPPEFEVATIKPTPPSKDGSLYMSIAPDPALFRITGMNMANLILYAYDLKPYQLSKPDWMSEPYDIVAKMPPGATRAQTPAMLQALLAQRFHLKVHRESKVLPVYALVVSSGGLKIRPSSHGQEGRSSMSDGHWEAHATPLSSLALSLGGLDRPVVDETGVSDAFDFTLDWAVDEEHETAGLPSLRVAVEEKLGLKLKPCNRPIDMLIIDHIDKHPSAN
jgi:uncharacterized protein (TIGR03435 family)